MSWCLNKLLQFAWSRQISAQNTFFGNLISFLSFRIHDFWWRDTCCNCLLNKISDLISVFLIIINFPRSFIRCSNGEIDRALSPHSMKGTIQRKTSPLQPQSSKNGCTTIMGDTEMSTSKPNQVIPIALFSRPKISRLVDDLSTSS